VAEPRKPFKPQRPLKDWLESADSRYIGARYLYWKGLTIEFILAMAHSLELFFKTYLYLKQGEFTPNHGLTELCRDCANHGQHFLAYLEDPNWDITGVDQWLDFWKYPEGKNQPRPRHSVWGTDDLFRLDSIARVVHVAVDPSNSDETEIRRLILRYPISALAVHPDPDPAVRALFLHRNDYFDEDGWPVTEQPKRDWRRKKHASV
jgi:hypothetical protein